MSQTPSQQRSAAHSKWAYIENRTEATASARAASLSALDARLCEHYGIDVTTKAGPQRLEAARKAHFTALAHKSAQARARKSGAK